MQRILLAFGAHRSMPPPVAPLSMRRYRPAPVELAPPRSQRYRVRTSIEEDASVHGLILGVCAFLLLLVA